MTIEFNLILQNTGTFLCVYATNSKTQNSPGEYVPGWARGKSGPTWQDRSAQDVLMVSHPPRYV